MVSMQLKIQPGDVLSLDMMPPKGKRYEVYLDVLKRLTAKQIESTSIDLTMELN
jgi:hypothetical protein